MSVMFPNIRPRHFNNNNNKDKKTRQTQTVSTQSRVQEMDKTELQSLFKDLRMKVEKRFLVMKEGSELPILNMFASY